VVITGAVKFLFFVVSPLTAESVAVFFEGDEQAAKHNKIIPRGKYFMFLNSNYSVKV